MTDETILEELCWKTRNLLYLLQVHGCLAKIPADKLAHLERDLLHSLVSVWREGESFGERLGRRKERDRLWDVIREVSSC